MRGKAIRRGPWIGATLLLALATGCVTPGGAEDAGQARRRAASHFNLAVDHSDNGRIELALRELLSAERIDPSNARVQHALALAYLQKGKTTLAEEHLLRALDLAPGYQEARYNLSSLYLNQRRYEASLEHSKVLYDDATFTQPWRALTNWGWAAYKLGRTEEARARLEHAREFNHRYWPTYMNIGILEQEAGNRQAAVAAFSKALTLRPAASAAAEANYRLAEIYVSMGRRGDAVGHLRTAVVKAPGDPWGRKSEAYLKQLR